MKVKKISVDNYRNFTKSELYFNETINFVVGRNNIGKSNLLLLFSKIFKFNKFKEEDYKDISKPIKVTVTVKFNEAEIGVFEDLFTPEDCSELKLLIKQDDPFSDLIVSHIETSTIIPTRSLKYFNTIYYDSAREPENIDNLNNKNSSYNIIPLLVDKFYEKIEPTELFSDKDQINNLLDYLNKNLNKIDTIRNENVGLNIQKDNQIESIKRLMFLEDKSSMHITQMGSGVQYVNMVPFNIIRNLINRSRYTQSFKKMIKHDSDDNKYIEYIVGLDEPEIHLHPHLQRYLMEYLVSIFSGKNLEFNSLLKDIFDIDYIKGQIIVATHSPNIILDKYQQIIRFYESNNKLIIKSGEQIKLEKRDIKFLYMYMPFLKKSFFSKVIIIVEGDSEILAFKKLSERMEINLNLHEIEIISAGGKDKIPPLVSLFERFGIKTVSLFDRDDNNHEDSTYNQLRNSFFTMKEEFEDEIIANMSGLSFGNFLLDLGSNQKKSVYRNIKVESKNLLMIKNESYNLDDFVNNTIAALNSEEISNEDLDKLLKDNQTVFTDFVKSQKSIITGQLLMENVLQIPQVFKNVLDKAVELSNE